MLKKKKVFFMYINFIVIYVIVVYVLFFEYLGWDFKVWLVVLYFNQVEIYYVQVMYDLSLIEENFGFLGEE